MLNKRFKVPRNRSSQAVTVIAQFKRTSRRKAVFKDFSLSDALSELFKPHSEILHEIMHLMVGLPCL